MTKQELLEKINQLPDDANIRFVVWDDASQKTVDMQLSGCTPTGQDGVTRIGLSIDYSVI